MFPYIYIYQTHCNTVSLQVLGRGLAFFTMRDQFVAQQIFLLRVEKMLRKEEHGSTLLLVFHQTHYVACVVGGISLASAFVLVGKP